MAADKAKKDAEEGSKLDKLLELCMDSKGRLDSLCTRMDSYEADKARKDAEETPRRVAADEQRRRDDAAMSEVQARADLIYPGLRQICAAPPAR